MTSPGASPKAHHHQVGFIHNILQGHVFHVPLQHEQLPAVLGGLLPDDGAGLGHPGFHLQPGQQQAQDSHQHHGHQGGGNYPQLTVLFHRAPSFHKAKKQGRSTHASSPVL